MTKEQERARARRRHEEQQKSAKPPVGDSTRDKQVFGVILAVILVIAAVIVVPKLVGSSDAPTPAAGVDDPASAATARRRPAGSQRVRSSPPAARLPRRTRRTPKQQTEVPGQGHRGRQDLRRHRQDDVRRPDLRARRRQGAADGRVVPQPRQDRLLGAEPLPPRHDRGHLRAPVRRPDGHRPGRPRLHLRHRERARRTGSTPPGCSPWPAPRTRTATAASSSSPTRKPSCPPTAVATRSSGR